jgi:hypothetical protein
MRLEQYVVVIIEREEHHGLGEPGFGSMFLRCSSLFKIQR